MKINFKFNRNSLKQLGWKGVWNWIVVNARKFWVVFTRRFWMKLLSFLLAILLWNYVVITNPSFTRTKVLSGLSGYITSQSTLSIYKLALLDDPTELLDDVSVRLDVSQSDFSKVSTDNVKVTLDLSTVRTAGTQQVPLKATTAYGRVVEVLPETLTLTFETLDSRSIPVNVQTSGTEGENCWYSVSRTNPSAITVSGAASVVRSIAQARVYSDVTGATDDYVRAEPFVLLDGEGNEISQSMLSCSSSSITVVMSIYPTRELPISAAIESVITGQPAEGYVVSDVSIQPGTVTLAAEAELLEGVTEIHIEPVSVEGAAQSFSARAKLSLLSGFKNVSAEQVYVNVTLEEQTVGEWIENSAVSFSGKAEGLQLSWEQAPVKVYVSGPRSAVAAIRESGIPISVDLTGLQAGTHECPLIFPEANSKLSFEPETPTINVTLLESPAE